MNGYSTSCIGALLFLTAAPAGAVRPQTYPIQAIPVEVSNPFSPSAVPAEGREYLLYELHLTNFGKTDLQLVRVDVLNPRNGAILQSLTGKELASTAWEPGDPKPNDSTTLLTGRRMVIFMDVRLPEKRNGLIALGHRLAFVPIKTINGDEQSLVEPSPVVVSTLQPPVLGAPLRGGCWVASHALSNDSSHRRTLIALNGRIYDAQRYAIDWIRIGPDGQAFRSDPAKNVNWTAYGADVLSVADGIVREARDGIAENDPTSERKAVSITLDTAGGNHLLLDIGHGFSVFYAHLQPGTIKVHAGDYVRKGQLLGKVGNSGQADAPHLHLHLVIGKSALAAEGEPLIFDGFTLQGHLPSLSLLANGDGWRPSETAQPRRREMPVENSVVAFPDGPSPCAAK